MATYYIAPTGNDSTGTGSSGSPWKTMDRAHTAMSSGDTCILKNGTYLLASGQGIAGNGFGVTKANTTWRAESEHGAIIRGNWSPALLTDVRPPLPTPCGKSPSFFSGRKIFMPKVDNYLPRGGVAFRIKAENVTLDGVVFECIASAGVMLEAGCSGSTVENCVFYWTYGQGIICYPGGNGANPNNFATDITIENNKMIFSSTCTLDVHYVCAASLNAQGEPLAGGDPATGAFRIGNVKGDTVVRGNYVGFSFGEGMDFGKRPLGTATTPIIVENNTVHDCRHALYYAVNAFYVTIRNNVAYNINGSRFWDDLPPGDPGNCYKVNDERIDLFDQSTHIYFYNNIGYNGDRLMSITQATENRFGDQVYHDRVGMYIGWNTFISGPFTHKRAITLSGTNYGVFENNLILNELAPGDIQGMTTNNPGSMTVRRNAWTQQPPTAWRNAADVVAASTALKLSDPRRIVQATGFDYYTTYAGYLAGYSDNFQSIAYIIGAMDSPLIGAAGTRAAQGTFWPPLHPFQYDIQEEPRGTPGDIGAWEWPGVVTHQLSGAIDATTSEGEAPLSVTFTDDHTATGSATVNAWAWDFGDGTTATTEGPHTKIYSVPGQYAVTLTVRDTVRNLSAFAAVGVTVTEAVAVAGAVDAVRVAAPTATGNFNIAFSLGGATPDLVLLYMTNATGTSAKTDHALFCNGAAGMSGQWAAAVYGQDAQATTATRSYYATDACLLSIDDSGVTGRAARASLSANRLTLNVTDAFPAGYLITAVALVDNAHQVAVGSADMRAAAGIDAGFSPDFMALATTLQGSPDVLRNGSHLSFGALSDRLAKAPDMWIGALPAFFSRNNNADSITKTALRQGQIGTPNSEEILTLRHASSGATFDKSAAGNLHGLLGYAAIRLGGFNQGFAYGLSPTSTGLVNYAVDVPTGLDEDGEPVTEAIQPSLVFLFAMPTANTTNQPQSGDGFSLAIADSGATYGYVYGNQDGQATSNTWTRATNNFQIRTGDDTLKAAGTVAITGNGFSINWTTVDATTSYLFYALALREPLAVSGPTAGFTFTVDEDGYAEFTDTSNPNGAAITEWLWDFGDGLGSTEDDPTHQYQASGTYPVTLTVTNANGSSSITRNVAVDLREPVMVPFGPYEPKKVTNWSSNKLYIDPSDPDFMRIEHGLDLDALLVDANPVDTSFVYAGKVRMVVDLENERFKLILPGGNIRYIDWSS